jgi:exodeoxyribonuclease VII large subunit
VTDAATFTVGELNSVIAEALVAAFAAPVWVRGEIQQLHTSGNGHTYFELVEKDPRRHRVRAVLRVALFRGDRPAINRALREVPGVTLADGVEVRIRGRVDYYPPSGRLQLVMTGVDPVFTVGRLAADRERLLGLLAAEGVLRANAEHEVALVPLRVGLVTSRASAAYHDFVHQLDASGYAFRVACADVRVQGAGSARRIAYALARLGAADFDVVALVRGGGARSDLAPFDDEALARAIVGMPVPVLTGIGHEIDRTVADEVAHTACKTPTAVAVLLVDRVDEYCTGLSRLGRHVVARARGGCIVARQQIREAAGRIHRVVPRSLAGQREIVGGRAERLEERARRALRDESARIDAAGARLRALDPRRVLERGYTITRAADGTVVRGAAAVAVGDELCTETADGVIASRVEAG